MLAQGLMSSLKFLCATAPEFRWKQQSPYNYSAFWVFKRGSDIIVSMGPLRHWDYENQSPNIWGQQYL